MDLLRAHGIGEAPIRATSQLVITPGTQDIVKPNGIYPKGFKVPGEPNLIPANILSEKSIFGIVGNLGLKVASLDLGSNNHYDAANISGDARTYTQQINVNFVPKILIMSGSAYVSPSSNTGFRQVVTSIRYPDGNINIDGNTIATTGECPPFASISSSFSTSGNICTVTFSVSGKGPIGIYGIKIYLLGL